ncbi:MAG: ABC transporter substrate-binding protein [Brevibacterium sp.]|nr:ABC transporter substrate-binding protein [Brevibacterium sp.]
MTHKLIPALAFASALVLAASGCGSSSDGDSDADLKGEGSGDSCTISAEVPVSAAFSLTGAAANYGGTQKNGLELAAKKLNENDGVKYKVTVEDDQTDPKQGIQLFQQFASGDASVIVGPTLSNTAKQTDPVAQDSKVPVLGVSNTAAGITEIGDYVFRDSLTEEAVIPQTVTEAKDKLDLKHVVVMYSNDDAFTESGYKAFAEALDSDGVKVDQTLKFSKSDTDFHALLNKAKESKPDAIVVSALIEAAVPLVTQARELGIDVPIVGGNGFNSPTLISDAGDASDGVIVGAAWNSASDNEQNQAFLKDYKAEYDSAPDQFAAQAYAGLQVIDAAVREGCSGEREDIKTNLNKVKDLPTVLGDFSIDENRDAKHEALVQVVKDGKFDILK